MCGVSSGWSVRGCGGMRLCTEWRGCADTSSIQAEKGLYTGLVPGGEEGWLEYVHGGKDNPGRAVCGAYDVREEGI